MLNGAKLYKCVLPCIRVRRIIAVFPDVVELLASDEAKSIDEFRKLAEIINVRRPHHLKMYGGGAWYITPFSLSHVSYKLTPIARSSFE